MNKKRLKKSLEQWRDSLVNLTSRNKLLNYKKSRASTIEFTRLEMGEVFERLVSGTPTFIVGIRPEARIQATEPADIDSESVEDLPETGIDYPAEPVGQIFDAESADFPDFNPEFDYSQHKDSLFADLTQKEINSILQKVSSAAKREFMEKGISPLYLAFGALKWLEDSGDLRTSPLILVPVELRRDGPRQPLRILRGDEDITVNPALVLKLQEFGIELPSAESVLEKIESEGMESALSLFSQIPIVPEWSFVPFTTLAIFAFQKEAMYKDLLDNENTILGNPLIQSLGGGVKPEDSEFYFDELDQNEIDTIAPPESTPLVLDADSSQRAAVAAALSGHSFVLDGPPGTGKSQTISNIIGALIESGKSVLFVSEKIVALEVVKDRLDQRGLGAFIFELHSHKSTRKEVAKFLGNSVQFKPVAPPGMSSVDYLKATQLRVELNDYADAINEVRAPLGLSVHRVLGMIEGLKTVQATPRPETDIEDLELFELESIKESAYTLGANWALFSKGMESAWYGVEDSSEITFKLERSLNALSKYETSSKCVLDLAKSLGVDVLGSGVKILELDAVWRAGSVPFGTDWLTVTDLGNIQRTITQIAEHSLQLAILTELCNENLGRRWNQILLTREPVELDSVHSTNHLFDGWRSLSKTDLAGLITNVVGLEQSISRVVAEAASFENSFGVQLVRNVRGLEASIDAISLLGAGSLPPTSWLRKPKNRQKAKEAYEALRPLVEASNSLRTKSAGFTEAADGLNLVELADYFSRSKGLFISFSAEYRKNKKILRGGTYGVSWKRALEELPFAIHRQEANAQLAKAEERYSKSLAGFYESLDTDWLKLQNNLKTAKKLLSVLTVTDVGKFESASGSKQGKKQLVKFCEFISALSEQFESVQATPQLNIKTEMSAGSLRDVQNKIGAARTELVNLNQYFESIKFDGVNDLPISQLIKGLRAIWDLTEYRRVLEPQIAQFEALLGVSVSLAGLIDGSVGQLLNNKLAWTSDIRRLSCPVESGKGSEYVLNPAQVQALDSLKLSADFEESVEHWGSVWPEFLALFSDAGAGLIADKTRNLSSASILLRQMRDSIDEIDGWNSLRVAIDNLESFGLSRAVDAARELELLPSEVVRFIQKSVLSAWVDQQINSDSRLGTGVARDRKQLVDQYRELDVALRGHAISQIIEAGVSRRPTAAQGQSGILLKESQKKTRHIPVRELLDRSRDVVQKLHPCFMMSPLAVSQYLPADIKFDVVIFDEASQVTPADAINCIYRGESLIAAGDQKQLPPMSFFAASGLEDQDEDDYAGDFDSILDLMKGAGSFNSMTLNWHYRSRHEHLIAYSNFAFYGSKLVTFPGAVSESDDLGVKFFKSKGVYKPGAANNPLEARDVATRVVHHFDSRPEMSLGVVAFSAAQRDAIENAVARARQDRPDLDRFFEDSRQDGFFVNSLEAVQGDERDAIIFSIGYGPDENGKINKNFGPLNRAGGERRLNVAITRARKLVEIVTSMTAAELGDVSSEGARHMRKYLDFAERGPVSLEMELGESGMGTDSPFEDGVIDAIRSMGYEVQPQVGVAGYRIDIGVRHPNSPGAFILGVECDGAMYHSSKSARDRDRLRHEILEGLGWKIHHIWGTAWYRNRDKEVQRLREILEAQAVKEISGRLVVDKKRERLPELQIVFEENKGNFDDSWVSDYVIAEPATISSSVDLAAASSLRLLTSFVTEVVEIEAPIHIDLLLQRLRDSSGISQVGKKIRTNVLQAIYRSKVLTDGDFLFLGGSDPVRVRRPAGGNTRSISQISPEELRAAIRGCVKQAMGIQEADLTKIIAGIYGWKRIGSQIVDSIEAQIIELIDRGELLRSSAGVTLSGS